MATKDSSIRAPVPVPAFGNSHEMAIYGLARFFLPRALVANIAEEQEAEEQAKLAARKPKPFDYRDRTNAGDLASIRAGTENDLEDAHALAHQVFKGKTALDSFTAKFSRELFVAVALFFTYNERRCTFPLMIDFLTDKDWSSPLQMLLSLQSGFVRGASAHANDFMDAFHYSVSKIDGEEKNLVARCVTHWESVLTPKKPKVKKTARTVQVFQPEAIRKALGLIDNMREESRAGGKVMLKNAYVNEGHRTVPDARQAVQKLETAKTRFENLIEPIGRLQTDLTLAGAMPPDEFRITPILLLGDPGIGKTFLAMQLADALGVKTDKISAGGAQGGFMLSGSHSSWHSARNGSLFTLLAEGKSAAPVMVIDEVDKIVDSKFPVLPVLLDLFEPDTARGFKDEFFDMQFDASRVIFILTANTLEGIPTPLLSRLEVFDVPRPQPEQRLRIIQAVAETLRHKTKKQIELDETVCNELAERVDLDLRKTTRLVKEAFAKAVAAGAAMARFEMPKKEGRRAIGFGC